MFIKNLISYCQAKVSIVKMKVVVLVCFFCGNLFIGFAQQNHFMYLQTENKQSFYVKLNKKIYSSSGSGYLVIPKLSEGAYSFQIGFPKNELPEQAFTYSINKDAGFIIKNLQDKGWGLFNLQSMDMVMAGVGQETKPPSAINETATTIDKNQNIPPSADTTQLSHAPGQQITKEAIVNRIKKIAQNQDDKGISIVFEDVAKEHTDTIRVLIPIETNLQDTKIINPAIDSLKTKSAEPENKFLDIELRPQNVADSNIILPKTDPAGNVENHPTITEDPIPQRRINPGCKDLANEQDFLKLRKKMAAEDNDDDMIAVAKKNFKSKCYTTEQIKNLSLLFLKEEDKYKFYDVAYPYAFDLHNFGILQSQLSNEYYINRFKALIHN